MTTFPPSSRMHRLSFAIALSLITASTVANAHVDPIDEHKKQMDAITVTASPLRGKIESIAKPVEVLAGEALDREKAATLGVTLSNLPGIQSNDFGTGVSRPIIRGQEGPRVQLLSGGLGTLDVSTVSADHAVTIEPFLADQIEVLKGPATLLFGSGAIGGAINIADGRIASELPDQALSGRAELRGNSVNDETTGMFRVDLNQGQWVFHADGLIRNTHDTAIPGTALLDHTTHDDHDHHDQSHGENSEKLANSALRTRAGGVGVTRFGDHGYTGVAYSTYRSNYGIPDGAHDHAHDDEHHDHAHDDHQETHDDHGSVRVDLVQNRWDLRSGLYQPLSGIERIDFRFAHNDYTHTEFEGQHIGTVFDNRGWDGRLELIPSENNGWQRALGLQFGRSTFSAVGAEAFVPAHTSQSLGLFALQEKNFDPIKLELGGRYDRVKSEPLFENNRSFGLLSLSADSIWHATENIDLRFGLDRSERAPINEEMHANGHHIATRSIEIGNPSLNTEKATRLELGLHRHTDFMTMKAAIYQTRFDDFIYLADTGVLEQGTPVRAWTQHEARFRGAEVEALMHLADNARGILDLRLFADTVSAKLTGHGTREIHVDVPHGTHHHHHHVILENSGYLPRIAPTRVGASLLHNVGSFSSSLGAVRYQAQKDLAQYEDPSAGYTLVNAHLSYRWDRPDSSWEVFLDGTNLTDKEARPHTSLLRNYAPLPGRAIAFGLRVFF